MKTRNVVIALILTTMIQSQAFAAETYTQLIEQAVYQEEVSGDLNAAIKTYTKIVDGSKADRTIIAEAMYRMAHCYVRTGEIAKAKDLLSSLIRDYPEQKPYLAKAQSLMKETQLSLVLKPAPWMDGEKNRFHVMSPAGKQVGMLQMEMQRTTVDGIDAWTLHNEVVVPLHQLRQYTDVTMAADDMALIRAEDKSTLTGEVSSVMQDSIVKRTKDDKAADVKANGLFFHKEQITYLLRRLSLAKDETLTLSIYDAPSDSVHSATIKNAGIEELDIAGQKQQAQKFKITLDMMETSTGNEDTAWVSTDSKQQLLKYETRFFTAVLDTAFKPEESVTFSKAGTSLTLKLPKGWSLYDATDIGPAYDVMSVLMPPTFGIEAMFVNKMIGEDHAKKVTVQQIVDGDIGAIKGFFKNYEVRKGTRIDHKVSGLAAQTYAADFEFQNKKMVEYRTYILGKKDIYWFVFRVEQGRLPEFKAQLDNAIAGLKAS